MIVKDLDIQTYQHQLRRFRDERDWRRFHTPQNLAQALHVEAGELSQCFLWGEDWSPPDRERVSEECADVLIYLLQLADVLQIDLETAVQMKIECNGRKYPAQKRLFDAGPEMV